MHNTTSSQGSGVYLVVTCKRTGKTCKEPLALSKSRRRFIACESGRMWRLNDWAGMKGWSTMVVSMTWDPSIAAPCDHDAIKAALRAYGEPATV